VSELAEEYRQLVIAARDLLDAMDRQYGQPIFSASVDAARKNLRTLVPRTRSPLDKSRERAGVA